MEEGAKTRVSKSDGGGGADNGRGEKGQNRCFCGMYRQSFYHNGRTRFYGRSLSIATTVVASSTVAMVVTWLTISWIAPISIFISGKTSCMSTIPSIRQPEGVVH